MSNGDFTGAAGGAYSVGVDLNGVGTSFQTVTVTATGTSTSWTIPYMQTAVYTPNSVNASGSFMSPTMLAALREEIRAEVRLELLREMYAEHAPQSLRRRIRLREDN